MGIGAGRVQLVIGGIGRRNGGNPGRSGGETIDANGEKLGKDLEMKRKRRHDQRCYFPSKRPDCGGDCGVGRPSRS